ncbi:MAG: peptidase M28 [Sphingomonas sp. SCN 67-18]|uniref:M28 family metallopeptidase n=1 Tax=uncultured Sphingomonas sp. TaxID=158754 RepID=UPI00086C7CE7|nr:M28 family metallopeptidase [Sphingomonas sp. SCN 67-18]ODU21729.1 MAG: peptidase M28 [Sphingomonas sp. SCN 67-18]
MTSRLSIAFAASLLAAASAPAFAAAAPNISVDTLKDVTRTLSSDAFEGRAPASPGEEKTVTLIADRFAKAGLQPGNAGSWYQDVPLVEITAKPDVAIDISGGKAPLHFAYKTDMVVGTYQVQPRVEVKDSDIVFVGYGINAPERGWNDYAGLDVRGKTVIILVNDPDWQNPTLEGDFGGRAMTYYGRWPYKYEEAARQGAAAALIVHDTEPAAYGFNVVTSSWTGPQFNIDSPNGHADQSKAIGWITHDAAERLMASAGQDLNRLTAAAKMKGFKAVPLGLKASLTLENTIRKQASRNVVGILPGKTRPDEYVLYSAHWDHLGRCEPVNGDDICNGAVDNASGSAALVAIAEAYGKAPRPERSVVFLAVTAEESGLLGSAYYAAHPLYPLGKTVGAVNMDGLNMLGRTRDVVLSGGGKSELEAYLDREAKAQGRVVKPEPTPEKGYYYRSDHFSFAKQGVPALSFGAGEDLVNGGVTAGKAAAEDYEKNRYHAPADEYDETWDWAGALEDVQLYYTLGRDLADGNDWPNWYPTAEFRATRDKSRGTQ